MIKKILKYTFILALIFIAIYFLYGVYIVNSYRIIPS